MASNLSEDVIQYFKNMGKQGGATKTPRKRKAAQTNVAKARQSRWKPRLLKKETTNDQEIK